MREIKFRAWDINQKVMVPLDKQWICYEYSSLAFDSSDPKYRGISAWPVRGDYEQAIMQSTGLYDIDGKEIFEGDILSSKEAINQTVEWDTQRGMWIVDGTDNPVGQLSHWAGECTIVGNMYENPELLAKN